MDIIEEKKPLLKPKIDVVFQALFRVGNEDITKAFIEKLIHRKIKAIDLDRNQVLDNEYVEQKLGILDLKVTLDDNSICNIEIQLTDKYNIEKRMLHYWGKLYSSQLKVKEDYKEIKPVISILITDYEIKQLKGNKAYTKWQIIEVEERKTILTNDMELHIIVLPRAIRELEDEDLRKWLMFLENPNDSEVKAMTKKDKELENAMERLETISGDEHLRYIAELKEKAIHDEISALNGARREGLSEGEKIGEKKRERNWRKNWRRKTENLKKG